MKELRKVRNIRPGFNKGLWFGLANAGWETATAGLSPWTLKNHADQLFDPASTAPHCATVARGGPFVRN